jgi:hypothetical protein
VQLLLSINAKQLARFLALAIQHSALARSCEYSNIHSQFSSYHEARIIYEHIQLSISIPSAEANLSREIHYLFPFHHHSTQPRRDPKRILMNFFLRFGISLSFFKIAAITSGKEGVSAECERLKEEGNEIKRRKE